MYLSSWYSLFNSVTVEVGRDLAFLGMKSIPIDSKSFEGVDYLPVCHDLQIMRGKEILHHSWTKTDVTL